MFLNIIIYTKMEKAWRIKEKGKISLGCAKQKQMQFEEILEVLYLNL